MCKYYVEHTRPDFANRSGRWLLYFFSRERRDEYVYCRGGRAVTARQARPYNKKFSYPLVFPDMGCAGAFACRLA